MGKNFACVCIVAIVCVTIIESIALCSGINGVLLSTCIGAIFALPTFIATKILVQRKHKKHE